MGLDRCKVPPSMVHNHSDPVPPPTSPLVGSLAQIDASAQRSEPCSCFISNGVGERDPPVQGTWEPTIPKGRSRYTSDTRNGV